MEMFGILDLATGFEGCRFAIGVRNANNKRFRLACNVGFQFFVCHDRAFRGDFSPVLAKHSKHLSLEDTLSIGVAGCSGTLNRFGSKSRVGAHSNSQLRQQS